MKKKIISIILSCAMAAATFTAGSTLVTAEELFGDGQEMTAFGDVEENTPNVSLFESEYDDEYQEPEIIVSGDFRYEVIPGTNNARIKSYTGTDKNLVIPSVLDGKTVTEVEELSSYEYPFCNPEKVSFPETVTLIGNHTYDGDVMEGNLTFGSDVKEFTVAEGNPNYCAVDGVLFTKDMSLLLAYPTKCGKTTYTVPASVKNMSGEGNNPVFDFHCDLKSVSVEKGNTAYSAKDGVLFSKDQKTLFFYPPKKPTTTYTIPDGVEAISSGSIAGSNYMKKIRFPKSVKFFGMNSVYSCKNLKTAVFFCNNWTAWSGVFGMGTKIETVYGYSKSVTEERFADEFSKQEGITFISLCKHSSSYRYTSKVTEKADTKYMGYKTMGCKKCGTTWEESFYGPTKVTLNKTSLKYNGKNQHPTVKAVYDFKGKKISSSNYTVSYPKTCKKIGTYTISIVFKGKYYKGKLNCKYKIVK